MRFTLIQLRNTVLALAVVLLAGGIGYWLGQHQLEIRKANLEKLLQFQSSNRVIPQNKQDVDFSLFWEVWDKLERDFLFKEKIDRQKMIYGAISGMTAALDDPYTAFFPPQDNKMAKENLNGAFEGVGIQLGYKKLSGINQLAVIAPISGMPAEKAGVKAGDYIVKIIDEDKGVSRETSGISLPEAVELIRGEKGTKVKLELFTEGDEKIRTAEIIRETIVVPSVEVKFGSLVDEKWQEEEDGKIAWLRLSRFGGLTDDQWDEAVEEILKQRSLKAVILDVRNNPGGFLEGAVNLAGEFLPQGKIVVRQEHSQLPPQDYSVKRIGRLTTVPLAVLINKGSASASEILAGALQENDRAELVGETSFGKGTIQEAEDLRDGAGLHVTIARWLTPDGNWVHEKGLEPNIAVVNDPNKLEEDKQLVEALKLFI